jgi:dolichol-phosphate mannosyltransferase
MKLVSIVVPVYNEQDNIDLFKREVCKSMEQLPYRFEIIFVDDGSSDATPAILHRLASEDPRVQALILARNYGHQVAISCGLDHADGDAVISMDGDMQHPPEMLPQLLAKWEEGYDVVQTIRLATEGVSWFKNFTSRAFYWLMNAMSKVHVQEGGSDFRLLDKRVVESFRRFRETARFIRGMISAIGYRQTTIEFVAPPRHAGVSKFSLRKMMTFALDGITAYSKLPLRFAFYTGIVCGVISVVSPPTSSISSISPTRRCPLGHPVGQHPPPRRSPTRLHGHHRRVRRPYIRRSQAAAALPRARGTQPAAAGRRRERQ